MYVHLHKQVTTLEIIVVINRIDRNLQSLETYFILLLQGITLI